MNLFATPAAQLRTDSSAQNPAPGQSHVLGVHVLQVGETIRSVAARYRVSPEAILAANPQISPAYGLQAGTQLTIPAVYAAPTGYMEPSYAAPAAPTYTPASYSTAAPAYTNASYAPAQTASYTPDASSYTSTYPSIAGLPAASAPRPASSSSPRFDIASPNATGVNVRTPARSFFSDPSSGAPPPQPLSFPTQARAFTYGDRSPDVETLQRALCRIGYAIRVDGDFGPATDAAIRNFQSLVGITPNGVMDRNTWAQLQASARQVRQPSQVLVQARREDFQSEDEQNAFDVMVALAYDDPGAPAGSGAEGTGLRELLRLIRQPSGTPLTITPAAVTAFAYKALEIGLPLNNAALSPLAPLRLQGQNRASYNEARALCDFFTRAMRGSNITNTTYDRMITSTAQQYGLPPELVKAVIAVESNFEPSARSSADARGLMQVIPDTAQFVGVSDISSPDRNILAGVRYLSYLVRRFDGSITYTAAGYNAGPGRVTRNGGVPPIQETYDYVRRVMVHYAYYLQRPPY